MREWQSQSHVKWYCKYQCAAAAQGEAQDELIRA
jgi:hypothetical protein